MGFYKQRMTTRVFWSRTKGNMGDSETDVPMWLDHSGNAITDALMLKHYDALGGVADDEDPRPLAEEYAREVSVRIPIRLTRDEWLDALEVAMKANRTFSDYRHMELADIDED